MKTTATLIILITTSILVHTAALETPAPAQDIRNISFEQKKSKTIINYQLNDHTFSFNAKILAASNTIKNMQEDCKESRDEQRTYFTKLLFDTLNHEQVKLLIKALKKDRADTDDDTKPSRRTTNFVHNQKGPELCWLADQTSYWDIRNVYNAAVKRITNRIVKGKDVPAHTLNDDIRYDVQKNIDCANLKIEIGTRLQHTINPFKQNWLSCANATFSMDGLRVLLRHENEQEPIYIYDLPSKKIIGSLTPPAYKRILEAIYACNDTRIIVTTSQEYPAGNLFVYDSQDLHLIKKIPLANYFNEYVVHNDHIATYDKYHVTIYTDSDISQINNIPSEQDASIDNIWYSPDGSQICAKTSDGLAHTHKLYIYAAHDRQLITVIEDSIWINPIYNSDGSKLIIKSRNRALIYNSNELHKDPQEIIHIQQNAPFKIKSVTLSPDDTQLAIVTSKALLLYDIETDTVKRAKFPYSVDDYNNYYINYSSDSSQLLLGTTDHYMLEWRKKDGILTCGAKEDTIQLKHVLHPDNIRSFNYYAPDCSRMLCWSDPAGDLYIYDAKTGYRALPDPLAEHSVRVNYSPDKTHMALSTRDGFMVRPTLKNVSFDHDIRHLQLMFKALSNNWGNLYDQPYAITTQEEKEVYDSLDPLLQDEQLFTVSV